VKEGEAMKVQIEKLLAVEQALGRIIKATEADEDDEFLPLSGEEAQYINIQATEALDTLRKSHEKV